MYCWQKQLAYYNSNLNTEGLVSIFEIWLNKGWFLKATKKNEFKHHLCLISSLHVYVNLLNEMFLVGSIVTVLVIIYLLESLFT